MPLSEQTVKKISLIGFISLAVLGALFLLFAMFLNKGTLTIHATAPYIMNIGNFKNESCPADDCSVTLAPGTYEVTLKKEGYRDSVITVDVPIGGEKKETVDFVFVPTLRLDGDESTMRIFATPVVAPADDMPDSGIFYENNYLAYIARDAVSHRQTLYVRTIADGKAGDKTVAASFVRDLKDFRIIGDIENRGKIAVIDSTAGTSTLYMVDLKAKTRENLFTYPLITDVKWIPGGGDFLFEARDESSIGTSIFLYSAKDAAATAMADAPATPDAQAAGSALATTDETTAVTASSPIRKLNLATPLADVVPANATDLIAATMQDVSGQGSGTDLEGQLVTLGENEATPSMVPAVTDATAVIGATTPALSFVDYSLLTDQARLLKYAPDLGYPSQATLSETQKSAYFLIDGKDYELQFSDQQT